jgi:hypothetical protein
VCCWWQTFFPTVFWLHTKLGPWLSFEILYKNLIIIEPHRKLALLTLLTCTCIHALSNCCPSCSRAAIAWLLGIMYYSRFALWIHVVSACLCIHLKHCLHRSEVTCVLSGLARLFTYVFGWQRSTLINKSHINHFSTFTQNAIFPYSFLGFQSTKVLIGPRGRF